MKDVFSGRVYVVGNDIDTDVIIPARYLTTMDPAILGKHAMEDLDPQQYKTRFLNADGSCNYQIVIAGSNFGCGSSREHAPIALRAAGIEAVVATSFARIYYRNSVNGGIILPLESTFDLGTIFKTGDMVEIDLRGAPLIQSQERGEAHPIKSFGPVKDIIEAGGLTVYNKRRLGLA